MIQKFTSQHIAPVKTRQTIINIGLNVNNKEPKNQLKKTLSLLNGLVNYRIESGNYNGVKERTLVAVVDKKNDYISLCSLLQQDCISTSEEILYYNPLFTGTEQEFNSELFIQWTASGKIPVKFAR